MKKTKKFYLDELERILADLPIAEKNRYGVDYTGPSVKDLVIETKMLIYAYDVRHPLYDYLTSFNSAGSHEAINALNKFKYYLETYHVDKEDSK